jgi:hypothetical protein
MSDSTISELNTLSIQYNNTLNLYKQTYQNYIDSLKLYNNDNKNFIQVPNTIYLGSNNLNSQKINDINNCQQICKSDKMCSGATYNLQNNDCSTKKGISNLIKGSQYDISIVPKHIQISYDLKNINNELILLNEKMMTLMGNYTKNYNQDILKTQKQKKVLKNNYDSLYVERNEINRIINQDNTINSRLNDSELKLNEYYSRYIFLLLAVTIIVIIFIYYIIPSISNNNLNGGSNKINLLIKNFIK